MNTTRDMAREVTDWAASNGNVRVALLTSSRANPRAPVDELSDYDIELYVRDLTPFLTDTWLASFGEILIREPPLPEISDDGNAGCMVIFKDAPRMDIGVELVGELERARSEGGYSRDIGYRVLLDKDDLMRGAIPPTHTEFDTSKPSAAEYRNLVNTFWWDITYVAKCLVRDEFYFAKYMLDSSLHHDMLSQMLSWHVGVDSDWTSNPGVHGRWLKRQVDPLIWADVEKTFAGADVDDMWRAMFETARVFGRVAATVGERLGYPYPETLEKDVTQYLREIRRHV